LSDKKKAYDVICTGILVADIFSSPLRELPREGMLTLVDRIYPATGGCAANTGVCLVKLGGRVGLVGKVGDDIFGQFVVRDMSEQGLDVSGITVSSDLPTSNTIILPVIDEDRRFIHVVGANADLGYDDIDLDKVISSRALYVGGFLLQPNLDQKAVARLFRFAKESGLITALDTIVPDDFQSSLEDALAEALPYTDVFLPNVDEAALLTGTDDPVEQGKIFRDFGCETVVITMGERGTVVTGTEQTLYAPSYPIDVVDPSGAGDAFDAGFLWGMLQGWDVHKTLVFASAMGASACLELGATTGVFTLAEAEDFIANNTLHVEVLS
jgi:sugar/nucleoside kinase (ribokinase family)